MKKLCGLQHSTRTKGKNTGL